MPVRHDSMAYTVPNISDSHWYAASLLLVPVQYLASRQRLRRLLVSDLWYIGRETGTLL
jgi:hypothetical protein